MQLRDVLLKATARQITWGEAAEIIGVSDRTLQRWRERLDSEAGSAVADHAKRRLNQKHSTAIFRARVQERSVQHGDGSRGVMAVQDEMSGSIAKTQMVLETTLQRGSTLVRAAMDAAQSSHSIQTDRGGLFLTSPPTKRAEQPRRRGMGVARPDSKPLRLRN
jgi:hypothetical protein